MNILLTTLNSKFIHTALSIRYLKSYVKDEFPNTEIEEYTINQNIEFIAREIYKKKMDIIAFSTYIWNMRETLEIAEILKTVDPSLTIILGGPEVSYDGEQVLKENPYIDYIIHGEGEETLKELLQTIRDKGNLSSVEGIVYRNERDILITSPRKLIEDLDSIPSPYDDDIESFKNKIAYFESSRGCPFNCQFCLSSTIKGVRFFSIERVKNDLKKLIDIGVSQVKFVDRTFNAKKGYAMEIMNFIVAQNTQGINFHFEVTAHLVDDEMLDFLGNIKEGLFQFEVGVQSTNKDTLRAIDRTTDFSKLTYVIDKINSYNNIHMHLDLIAGLPYENYASFRKSFNDVYALSPHKLQLGFLKLLKGSELRKKSEEYGFKFIDIAPYEVLENNWISYAELSELKFIEDMLERYGNEGFFKNTVDYGIANYFDNPFDLFESFGEFWEKNEYHKVSHARLALYEKLYEFMISVRADESPLILSLIKYDFLLNNKTAVLPPFLRNPEQDNLNNIRHDFLQDERNIEKYLPEYKGQPVKKILTNIHLEWFDYDMTNKKENKTLYLFSYNSDKKALERCSVMDITQDI